MAVANVPVVQGVAGGTPIAVDTGAGGASTGTITSVASVNSDTPILAANPLRLGGSVFNESTAVLYLALANVTSSATLYTVQLPPNGYFEIPFGFTGVLKGIWSAVNGSARCTEYTA